MPFRWAYSCIFRVRRAGLIYQENRSILSLGRNAFQGVTSMEIMKFHTR